MGDIGYDDELQCLNEVLRRAVGVQTRDHVLDVGCGSGLTTRQAARTAHAGSALGLDVFAPGIERGRELARTEGLSNVTFELGDAQTHPFPAERFDVAISRFGTMFFADPVAAFANVRRALRSSGRLVMMVWQSAKRNEWDVATRRALELPDADVPGGPAAFSLADPPTVRNILEGAGFVDVAFTDVHEPVYYGPDVTTALTWAHRFTCTNEALNGMGPDAATRALDRLRALFSAHLGEDGVWFGSRAWIVSARR